jgi:photosystem II stability/assembly factor-like uncharacterized protein
MGAMFKSRVLSKIIVLPLLILSLLLFFPRPGSANTQSWSRFNIPSIGVPGRWVLADGSDVRCLTLAGDGTLYCSASPAGTPFRFFKSTDSGRSWSYSGRVEDPIVDIAVSPALPQNVYYVTASTVYKSADGGTNFQALASNPGNAGENGLEITSLDVASVGGADRIVIAARDTAAGQYGGAYLLDASQSQDWVDLAIGSYDVFCVEFSPDYVSDHQVLAIVSNETDTIVTTDINSTGWGAQIGDAILPALTPLSAAIAFPDDYDPDISQGHYIQYIALDSGIARGDVYRLKGRNAPTLSELIDLDAGLNTGQPDLDIASLAVKGLAAQASLIAGTAGNGGVLLSRDGGTSWNLSVKSPSGSSETCVLMSHDYSTSGVAYAATCGTESAFSISRDRGTSWNQTGLIDSKISRILDLAVSPAFASDGVVFLVTADSRFSLWSSRSGGVDWERTFSSALPLVDKINRVMLSPRFQQNQVVFLAGVSEGKPVIWKSSDSGRTFNLKESVAPDSGEWVNIDSWAISPDDEIFVAGFNGEKCKVYQTGAGGLPYIDQAPAGTDVAYSLALSPDFNIDQSILLGNFLGRVFYSNDHGRVFEPLPFNTTGAPFTGAVSVAFDGDYQHSKTVYAADQAKDQGIFRFVTNNGIDWERIDTSLPQGAQISHISVSAGGVLYGVYSRDEINVPKKGGLERTLDASTDAPSFESVTIGLADNAVLDKLWAQDNTLWSVDIINTALMVYNDLLVSPVNSTSPPDGATGIDIHNIQIAWQAAEGAGGYHWQLDTDDKFVMLPKGYEGDTDSVMQNLPTLDLQSVYYWRVRVNMPVASRWSGIKRFDTIPPLAAPKLSSPVSSSRSNIQPVFKWSASEGAEHYDLLVAGDDAFSKVIIDKNGNNACQSNIWKCDRVLKYSTSYYWKVRAVCGDKISEWSSPGVFTTQKASSGSSSGGGSGPAATKTPTPTASPTPTHSPTSSPSTTTSLTPSASLPPSASTIPAPVTLLPSPTVAGVMPDITGLPVLPVDTASSPTPVSTLSPSIEPVSSQVATPSPETGLSTLNLRLVITLIAILVVLLVVLAFLVVYLRKKFKQF